VKRVTLALVGDVNCKADEGCEPALAPSVQERLARADVRIGNLEGALADPSFELHYKGGWFDCEPEMPGVVAPHFDAFACANNVHYGAAIDTSIGHLDRAGIPHTGAGATLAEALRPAIVERDGARVGLLAFTSVFSPDGRATESRPGVTTIKVATAYEPHWRVHEVPGGPATVRTIPDPDQLAAALDAIRRLRADVDEVVAYFRWGVSLSEEIAEYQRLVGCAAVEAGADVVVGSRSWCCLVSPVRLAELSAPFGTNVVADGDEGVLVEAGRAPASAA
jgi:poly-gamma-glutamate capsule biosynthesis protein CapA/YwtB (metallophosphatase superfamily)